MVDEFDRGEDSIDVHCRSIVPLEESFEKSKKKKKYSKRSTNDDCDSISNLKTISILKIGGNGCYISRGS